MKLRSRLKFAVTVCAMALALAACGSSDGEATTTPAEPDATPAQDTSESDDLGSGLPDSGPEDTGGSDLDVGDTASEPDVEEEAPLCPDGLPMVAFDPSGDGTVRHSMVADFAFTRMDGAPWQLSKKWTGCDVYVFVPDTIANSQLDSSSIWSRDVLELIEASPPNVHYFFVTRRTGEAATAALEEMNERIAKAVQLLPAEQSDEWWLRLHVVDTPAAELDSWLGPVMTSGIGQVGFAINRDQELRGIGSFADVTRFNSALQAAEAWPWEANLAYVAHDARFMNAQAKMRMERDAIEATEVVLFDGPVIEQFGEVEVELPSPEMLAQFDTFQIEIDMRCPNPALPEVGNCGAWDYLAHLYMVEPPPADAGEDAGDVRTELARFITTYHRESHWVHDVTPMMVHLLDGGTRKFRWEWAPEWNKQPTETRVKFRFANLDRGEAPYSVAWLYGGRSFNAEYNDGFAPLEVDVPADAARVELYTVITGHGADFAQCAEFCNHEHEWTINGQTFTEDHPTVGNQQGCIQELENGMTPNQWGTWWFGRGGWCPGQAVKPWTVDVTDLVEPGGTVSVSYRGLLGGQPVTQNAGNIVMTSYLVFYR